MAYGTNNQILTAQEAVGRNTNSIVEGMIDRGPWYYYDTVNVATGVLAASYTPFAVPQGSLDPLTSTTKTKLATNMLSPNSFPPPRCLLLSQIGFYFSSKMIKSDIDLVLDGCYFEFRIDDKIFHEGHLHAYASGMGLTGVSTNNGTEVFVNGNPTPLLQKRFEEWSKYIAPLQRFSMNIIFPGTPPTTTGPAGLYMVVTLDGLTDRSVQ